MADSLQRDKTLPTSFLDMTQNNRIHVVQVMLELCEMRSIPLLPSLPGPLWPRMLAPDRILHLDQIELYTYVKMNCLK